MWFGVFFQVTWSKVLLQTCASAKEIALCSNPLPVCVSSAGEKLTLGYRSHPAHGKLLQKLVLSVGVQASVKHHTENCLAGIVML